MSGYMENETFTHITTFLQFFNLIIAIIRSCLYNVCKVVYLYVCIFNNFRITGTPPIKA